LTEHAPRSFIRYSGFTLNLFCRDAATSGTHQVHSLKPDAERRCAFLKDRSGQRVNVIPAMVTGVSCAARHAVMFAILFALFAIGDAIRPALLFDRLKANIITRKISVKLIPRVAQMLWDCLSPVHNREQYALYSTCCQGIITNPYG
jgi:hypothetical protein